MATKPSGNILHRFTVVICFILTGVCSYPNQVISKTSDSKIPSQNFLSKFIQQVFGISYKFGFKSIQDGAVVGGLGGTLTVTPDGQAVYSIPIELPPGTNKMEPALTITYNSTDSNIHQGLLGMGFSLEGLTSITRCPSNKAQNGEIRGVDFTDSDRFCLSGQQLVAIKGTYGQDGTEYRTYEDTQTRIISHDRQGNGPAYFTVETKGGQTAIYGNTVDSQNKAQGTNTVVIWGINRIQDSVKNFITVQYFKNESTGSFYPIEVDYTGNDNAKISPYNSVKMFYEDRPDIRITYKSGSKNTLDKRLKTVQVYQGSSLVYEYKLNYEISVNTFRSRISDIQKCDVGGNCLPPTKFGWQTNAEGWQQADDFKSPGQITKDGTDNGVRFVDLDGDGVTDYAQNARDVTALSYLNTGNGWQQADNFITPANFTNAYGDMGSRLTDLNGDGLIDFVQRSYVARGR